MKKNFSIITLTTITNKDLKGCLNKLKNSNYTKLIYLWINAHGDNNISFNILKGTLTKLTSQEINNITNNSLWTCRQLKQNYNVHTPLVKITVNYKIL